MDNEQNVARALELAHTAMALRKKANDLLDGLAAAGGMARGDEFPTFWEAEEAANAAEDERRAFMRSLRNQD